MRKTSEIYKKIYHYTTFDGLPKILKSQSLWATHYKFLNDYSEIILFKDKLISLLHPSVVEEYKKIIRENSITEEEISKEGGLDYLVQHDTKMLVDSLYRATWGIGDIYILSFCGEHKDPYINENGLLSQWRGYGSGGGFALVFDTAKIEEILELEATKFQYSSGYLADLVYSDDDKKLKAEFSEDLAVLRNDVTRVFSQMQKRTEKGGAQGLHELVRCTSRYKHKGFHEENEVRTVVMPTIHDKKMLDFTKEKGATLKDEKEIKFREQNGQHIPYIELFNSDDITLPIEKIIVGPHAEQESRAASLRVMLKKTEIKITCSDIPYIGK